MYVTKIGKLVMSNAPGNQGILTSSLGIGAISGNSGVINEC